MARAACCQAGSPAAIADRQLSIIQSRPGPIWSFSKAAWPRSKLRIASKRFDPASDVSRSPAKAVIFRAASALSMAKRRCRSAYRTESTATATSDAATTEAVASTARFRRASFRSRYHADGGHASTGSSAR